MYVGKMKCGVCECNLYLRWFLFSCASHRHDINANPRLPFTFQLFPPSSFFKFISTDTFQLKKIFMILKFSTCPCLINPPPFSSPQHPTQFMAQTPSHHQNVQQSFESFFHAWLLRQQSFLDQLLALSLTPDSPLKIPHQKALIDRVLSHYHQYFLEKSRVAHADVFLLFSPSWLSSYERALLWIADYKPSLVLRLVEGAVHDLTPEQNQRLQQLKDDTRRQERIVTGIMAGVQESLAGPSTLQVARQVGRLLDGEIRELDSAMEMMKRAITEVLEKADELRVTTARRVVEILSPSQTVQFLAAAAEFQLRVRRWGMERDSQSGER